DVLDVRHRSVLILTVGVVDRTIRIRTVEGIPVALELLLNSLVGERTIPLLEEVSVDAGLSGTDRRWNRSWRRPCQRSVARGARDGVGARRAGGGEQDTDEPGNGKKAHGFIGWSGSKAHYMQQVR